MRLPFAASAIFVTLISPVLAQTQPHSVLLFVADGLRPGMVNDQTAPTMAALMARGVRFTNTHSIFPTFTTANASGMATGHLLGDTGDFSNTIYTAFPVSNAADSSTPSLESDPVLGDVDAHFSGDYLNEETILKGARMAGFSTASKRRDHRCECRPAGLFCRRGDKGGAAPVQRARQAFCHGVLVTRSRWNAA